LILIYKQQNSTMTFENFTRHLINNTKNQRKELDKKKNSQNYTITGYSRDKIRTN
jgi:hypothetical protein